MVSPMNGALYAHKAFRKELASLEEMVAPGGVPGDEQVAGLAERIAFFHPIVKGHNDGEEAVLWPVLDGKFPNISTPYTLDHRADEATFQTIETLLGEMGSASGDQRAEVADRLRRAIVALNVAVAHHSRKEDAHLAPLVVQNFPVEEQAALATGMVGYLPREAMPRMLPWMMGALSIDERLDYLSILKALMPAERFQAAAGWVKQGLPAGEWAEIASRMPEVEA